MSYRAYINGQKFFDTALTSEVFKLTQAQVTVPGSFTFTVPTGNRYHNSFRKLIDYIDVFRVDQNGREKSIYSGRVVDITKTFDLQNRIICEELISILNDSIFRPRTFENKTNREVFQAMVENHNSQVEEEKQLEIGRITVHEAPCYRAYENYETTLSRMKDLTEAFGGRLNIRRDGSSLYIDWLKEYDEGCDQLVDFGSNLLDLTENENATGVYTVLIPFGAREDNSEKRVDITSVTEDGRDYIVAADKYIQKYGRIVGVETWDDVESPQNLKAKAEAYLEEICKPSITINVTAVDLADTGLDVDSFHVGQKIKARSSAHELNEFFDCVSQTLDLLNPANNKLTLGSEKTGFVAQTVQNTEAQKKELEDTRTALQKAVDRATSVITGNEGGYVVVHDADGDGFPDEILIMDTPDIETAVRVWRWNNSGLGYSSTGYNGEFGLAMTIDGQVVADFVNTGTLNAEIIKAGIFKSQEGDDPNFYLDLINGILKGKFSELSIVADGKETDITDANVTVEVEYAESDSNTTVPTEGWSTTTPEYAADKYVWLRNKYTSLKGEVTYSSPACITGNGEPGKSIKDVEIQYAQNSSKTTAPSSGWSTTLPAWLPDKHIWLRNKILYTDDSVSYTTPSLQVDLDQTEIFNRLTNNGALQGIYMENGKLYVNGEYIQSNSIKANSVDLASLFAEYITATHFHMSGDCTIDIETDGDQKSVIKLKHGEGNYIEIAPGMLRIYSNGVKRHQFLAGTYIGYNKNGNRSIMWSTEAGYIETAGKSFSGTTSSNGFVKIADSVVNIMYVKVDTKLTDDFCFACPIWAYDNYSSNKGRKTYLRFYDGYGNPLKNTAVSGTYY